MSSVKFNDRLDVRAIENLYAIGNQPEGLSQVSEEAYSQSAVEELPPLELLKLQAREGDRKALEHTLNAMTEELDKETQREIIEAARDSHHETLAEYLEGRFNVQPETCCVLI